MTAAHQDGGPAPLCSVEYVEKQIQRIEAGLERALAGDYDAITLEDGDTMWGNFAMHINVVINAARNAAARARQCERRAIEARQDDGELPAMAQIIGPKSAVPPRDFVIDSNDRESE